MMKKSTVKALGRAFSRILPEGDEARKVWAKMVQITSATAVPQKFVGEFVDAADYRGRMESWGMAKAGVVDDATTPWKAT